MTRDDEQHLRTLSICHYALSAVCALFGLLPIFHLAIGIAIVTDAFPQPQKGNAPFGPEFVGWIFVVVAGGMMLFYWTLAVLLVMAARRLRERRGHTFCLVVAGASCLLQPLGMVLGVFTFIVLLRPTVREAFEPVPVATEEPDEQDEHDRYHTE